MASVQKFTINEVYQQLRHIERDIQHPKNLDIDPTRSNLNYSLAPDRGMTSYDYLIQRVQEVYHRKQANLIPMAGWVITAPDELTREEEDIFFQAVYDFLIERYHGEANCIESIVHYDEAGRPHMHFCFVPTVYDTKNERFKISAKECLSLTELRNFHPNLQKYLNEHKVKGIVHNGVTKKNGGNRTVRELKKERTIERERTYEREW